MAISLSLDLSNATFGDLYRFTDLARAGGMPDGTALQVDIFDNVGNRTEYPTLIADLGDVDSLVRPILLDGLDVQLYADALTRILSQEEGKADREILSKLLNDLYSLPSG
jgi:hypothetical protein